MPMNPEMLRGYSALCVAAIAALHVGACTVYGTEVRASADASDAALAETDAGVSGCTNESPQVVETPCREVGYKGTYTGVYRSTRQLDCKSQKYSEWVRDDSCKLVPFTEYSGPNNSVDLRRYFPATLKTIVLRRADGTPQSRYRMGPAFETALPSPAAVAETPALTPATMYADALNLMQPGALFIWDKTYGDLGATTTSTIAHLWLGEDKSVTEAGDWYRNKETGTFGPFGYGALRDNVLVANGLAWSAAGGLRTPASAKADPNPLEAQKYGLRIGNPPPRTSKPGGGYSSAYAWNKTVVVETLASYTPPYGRSSSGGAWGTGNSKAYSDVIRIVFYHGTHQGNHVPWECKASVKNTNPLYKDLYFNLPEYHSYVSEFYLAPNRGIIQEAFLYAEDGKHWSTKDKVVGACEIGVLFEVDAPRTSKWIWYVDDP
jgi:hypothetical protein